MIIRSWRRRSRRSRPPRRGPWRCVEDRLGGRDHRVDHQPRQQLEILGAPAVEVGEAREVGREVAREQAYLAADRVPQRGHAAEALARDEAEVGVVLVHVADEDLDRVGGSRARRSAGPRAPRGSSPAACGTTRRSGPGRAPPCRRSGGRRPSGRCPRRRVTWRRLRLEKLCLLEQLERGVEQRPARALLALLTGGAVFQSTYVSQLIL